ncbi:TetR/AcrR family transcriptional regulator [Speluncibacter jeojiensis]|uniref:TetR/AcrR family transcriptional regulator n=1 Tax=Speluncibacter jeojiensis TaxID=2710754 RepID=A0A9X4REJ8_9ACTN|nr:TetR/AcrR family transcriptional regulator [Corynebacteriales bacterium D3-21]
MAGADVADAHPAREAPAGVEVVKDSKAAKRIRDAAAEAFAENGYGGTTTRDIAARLGLSPAAMYPHYRSKEDLLYAISYEGHRRCVELLTDHDPAGADPATRLRSVVGAFAAWHATHHARGRVIQYELTALSPEHYRTILGLRRQSTQIVRRIVDAGAADGSFAVPDAEGVTLAITSLCVDICRWFPSGRYTEPDQLAGLYGELALRLAGA